MADPVNVTTDDLLRQVGALTMECKIRAAREEALLAELADLKNPKESKSGG